MGYIFCMMGKSASGKDTIYKRLLENPELPCKKIILYTTRPIRAGEKEGMEYHFVTDDVLDEFDRKGKIIEMRAYQTVHGTWRYATVEDGQIDLSGQSYLMIGTLEAFLRLKKYYGVNRILPIYIEVEDGIRLQRALDREREQSRPKYAELCRRFLADEKDFSEERLADANVTYRFSNQDIEKATKEIAAFIMDR
ncbi:MAG: guanylate kinase [Lachnospiraceae bacterium]|nr:guanylate kinase [Lachnospiraceae bacterium]